MSLSHRPSSAPTRLAPLPLCSNSSCFEIHPALNLREYVGNALSRPRYRFQPSVWSLDSPDSNLAPPSVSLKKKGDLQHSPSANSNQPLSSSKQIVTVGAAVRAVERPASAALRRARLELDDLLREEGDALIRRRLATIEALPIEEDPCDSFFSVRPPQPKRPSQSLEPAQNEAIAPISVSLSEPPQQPATLSTSSNTSSQPLSNYVQKLRQKIELLENQPVRVTNVSQPLPFSPHSNLPPPHQNFDVAVEAACVAYNAHSSVINSSDDDDDDGVQLPAIPDPIADFLSLHFYSMSDLENTYNSQWQVKSQ